MTTNETTSPRVVKIAARGMKKPETLTLQEIAAVCASCVTQFEKAKKPAAMRKPKKG